MPKKTDRPGWRLLYLEIPDELDDALRARCASVGTRMSDEVRLALRRHLAYPPPPETIPPLDDAPKLRRGRPRKKVEENS